MIDIGWLGVILAFVAGMGVAFVWNQKGVIADAWERLTGVTPDRSRPARTRNMTQLTIAVAVAAVGLALAGAITARAFGGDSVGLAVVVGLVAGLAFSASTLLQHNAFELNPARLTLINTGYQLVLFLVMSSVLGLT